MSTPEVKEFINGVAAKASGVTKEFYQQFADYYEKKLWHQLTLKLEEFVNLPQFESGDELLQLYQHFIKDFERKINQLSYAKIMLKITQQIKDRQEAANFLSKIAEEINADVEKEAYSLCLAEIAWFKLQLNQLDEARSTAEKVEGMLNTITGADPVVYSAYYRVISTYYKIKVEPTSFYKNSLLYLIYTPLESIPVAEQNSLAFDMGVAALVSQDIFNFGELLAHPILNTLDGAKNGWLKEFLFAFNGGDVDHFEKFISAHKSDFESVNVLVQNRSLLQEKISLLALMELVFNRSAEDRTLSFATIAAATKLPEEEVELLVMKALSVGLIKGEIDQVEEKVSVTWVQSRVLSLQQVNKLKDRVAQWKEQVKNVLFFMENQTAPELLA